LLTKIGTWVLTTLAISWLFCQLTSIKVPTWGAVTQ
jgi:hypothetical protein